jgi:hypothetical protein
MDGWTNGQMFTQYSGISSHSLRGFWIKRVQRDAMGQYIKVFTDYKNLMRDALGLTLDQVYQWRLLLE